ncbi:MAG: hypothetical protein WAN36_12460 [Calditrichia bacterium]
MIKVYSLKHISPQDALRLVHESGIIPYIINWGSNIDEPNKRLIFTLKHGGGDFEEELQRVARELDKFMRSIDAAP